MGKRGTMITTDAITPLLISAGVGALIGLERELRGVPAGMRTHALVALGSTIFTIASLSFGGTADASRVAAQVAVGVGFIAGGVIFKSQHNIHGMTTAANLWVVAALGIIIGLKQYYLAGASAVILLAILLLGRIAENRILHKRRKK